MRDKFDYDDIKLKYSFIRKGKKQCCLYMLGISLKY